jgi:hypothetical protein
MNDNVIPIRKSERLKVFSSELAVADDVQNQQIGFAYMKPNSKLLRLKLWMFPNEQYFIAPYENDPSKYTVLSLEEYQTAGRESRTVWNKVGGGVLADTFIRISLNFPHQEIFVSLFPDNDEPKEQYGAA